MAGLTQRTLTCLDRYLRHGLFECSNSKASSRGRRTAAHSIHANEYVLNFFAFCVPTTDRGLWLYAPDTTSAPAANRQPTEHKAMRIRGGGASKVSSLVIFLPWIKEFRVPHIPAPSILARALLLIIAIPHPLPVCRQ